MLREMKNDQLLNDIRRLVREERRITQAILERINEVEHRRLYAEIGYTSTFEWLVKDLGYSHPAAFRRLQAARLLRDVPMVSEKIQAGGVNLTTLSQLQAAITAEERRTGERMESDVKQDLLNRIENHSASKTERVLAEVFPEATINKERTKAIDEQHTRMTLVFTTEQMKKLERVRELSSHGHGGATWSELIEMLADHYLKQKDPLRQVGRERTKATSAAATRTDKAGKQEQTGKKVATPVAAAEKTSRRALPRTVRRAVWQRDGGRCTFRDPRTGRACGSKFRVEIDHIEAWAVGGADTVENLRCLCRTHNALAAERAFGVKKMQQYRRYAECKVRV